MSLAYIYTPFSTLTSRCPTNLFWVPLERSWKIIQEKILKFEKIPILTQDMGVWKFLIFFSFTPLRGSEGGISNFLLMILKVLFNTNPTVPRSSKSVNPFKSYSRMKIFPWRLHLSYEIEKWYVCVWLCTFWRFPWNLLELLGSQNWEFFVLPLFDLGPPTPWGPPQKSKMGLILIRCGARTTQHRNVDWVPLERYKCRLSNGI